MKSKKSARVAAAAAGPMYQRTRGGRTKKAIAIIAGASTNQATLPTES